MDAVRRDLVVSEPAWRRWTLFACIILLASGYALAYGLFVARGRDFLIARSEDRARRYSREHPLALPAHFDFGSQGGGAARLGGGWHAPEPAGTWSDAASAFAHVVIVRCDCDLDLRVSGVVYTSTHTPRNRVGVLVNHQLLTDLPRDEKSAAAPIDLHVPHALAATGILDVELRVQDVAAPLREGLGGDSRKLGFLLHAIDIAGAGEPAAPR